VKTCNALIKSTYVMGYTIHKSCCILFGQISASNNYDCYNMKLQSNEFRIINCVKRAAENLPCKQMHKPKLYLSCF